MDASAVRVVVVDDFEPWRDFVRSSFRQQPELQIVGEASNGLEAIQKAVELQPDLVILDIGLPELNGIEAARRIRNCAPKTKILFLSQIESREVVREAATTGASGYVVKADAARELLASVNAVLRGAKFFSSRFDSNDLDEAAD
jgi:DNA-binding NarL/FixJ family response regulator